MKKGDIISLDYTIVDKDGKDVSVHLEGEVQWVIDDEASVRYPNGGFNIINLKEDLDWKILVESVPSYQSSVANMTVEQLQASIDNIRNQRATSSVPKVKISKIRETVDKNDPLAVALASMPPDKKLALMKKLGMVD